MKHTEKLSRNPLLGGETALAVNDLRRKIADLTDEIATLRSRLDGAEQERDRLLGYQTSTQPIIGDLAHNPFASLERLRHKARKALRPPRAAA
jgi:hypothetical protein